MSSTASKPTVSSRERKEALRREILNTAEGFLNENAVRDLSVDGLMSRIGLTRTNFYRVFPSREALLLELLAQAGGEVWKFTTPWIEGTDSLERDIRKAVKGFIEVWADHAQLFTAIVEATYLEEGVATAWRDLLDEFSRVVSARITAEIKLGKSCVQFPEATARALVHMSEAFMRRESRDGPPEAKHVAPTLVSIWVSAIRGIESDLEPTS
jgi:AcrR family transcriptional regulator